MNKLYILLILILTISNISCKTNEEEKTKPQSKRHSKSMDRDSGPSQKINTFSKAKKLMKRVYAGHYIAFYSGCTYEYKRVGQRERIVVNAESCGYTPRKNRERGKYIEWEHVVPAWAFGHTRKCWREKLEGCKKKGRKCCQDTDPVYRAMENDLHNLQPAIGELNADRSNYRYGMISGERRQYGKVDFEIDRKNKVAEPRPEIRGDIARTYFYMEKTYGVKISDRQRKLFEVWNKQDPVDDWERERNQRISRIQGNLNPFIK